MQYYTYLNNNSNINHNKSKIHFYKSQFDKVKIK